MNGEASHASDPDGTIRWFIFCPHQLRQVREAQGWRYVGDLGPTHGCWSILMELRDDETRDLCVKRRWR